MISDKEQTLYSLCVAAFLTRTLSVDPINMRVHTHHLWAVTLTAHEHINKKPTNTQKCLQHRKDHHKHQHSYALLKDMCTQHTWSQVQKHAHKQTHTHTHTLTHCLISLRKAARRRLSVCLSALLFFWCVCDTTRPRSLPLRPLIPPVEMKCNGADSIRALPPRETQRNQITPNPSEPSQHSVLLCSWEGNKTMVANSLGSLCTYTHRTGMECDVANVEG